MLSNKYGTVIDEWRLTQSKEIYEAPHKKNKTVTGSSHYLVCHDLEFLLSVLHKKFHFKNMSFFELLIFLKCLPKTPINKLTILLLWSPSEISKYFLRDFNFNTIFVIFLTYF